ncbi:hypothetical protein JCGZ_18110 [Jatropha curcas]|uniref:Uncharacterized protein n=1 Tax=Jatropha curcas TaxID=180498 RepID=A0A067KE70_JATCU|nr:hypothetical protein JCGZ_18110 [Jatropha curcas]
MQISVLNTYCGSGCEGDLGSTIRDVLFLYGAQPKLVAQATTCGVCHMPVARAT